SSPHLTGCGGSITTGYSSPSAGCHRPSTRRPIGAQETRGPCWRLSNNQVSDKPGAVHELDRVEVRVRRRAALVQDERPRLAQTLAHLRSRIDVAELVGD